MKAVIAGSTLKLAEAGSGIKANKSFESACVLEVDKRNKRTVWTIATEPFSEAHFATFPTALVEPCLLAGCPAGGTVLDPFGGSGTVAKVAAEHGRNSIYIDLNKEYLNLALDRLGFNEDRLFDCHSYEVKEVG